MADNYNSSRENEDLAYDLRQIYAKIVGEHLMNVANARIERKYPEYFKALEDLYTIVRHKFGASKKGKKISWEQEESKKIQEYEKLYNEAIQIINQFRGVYEGSSQDAEGVAKIEKILRKIEMFLYYEMDEANVFGSKGKRQGMM